VIPRGVDAIDARIITGAASDCGRDMPRYTGNIHRKPAMRRSIMLLPFCLVVAMLAGCGNKGPLVLPPTRPAPATTAPAPTAPAVATSSTLPAADQP
jgi:predicted small lipoprotein YifL